MKGTKLHYGGQVARDGMEGGSDCGCTNAWMCKSFFFGRLGESAQIDHKMIHLFFFVD